MGPNNHARRVEQESVRTAHLAARIVHQLLPLIKSHVRHSGHAPEGDVPDAIKEKNEIAHNAMPRTAKADVRNVANVEIINHQTKSILADQSFESIVEAIYLQKESIQVVPSSDCRTVVRLDLESTS